jgi:rhodanese-related sulfurtransferase
VIAFTRPNFGHDESMEPRQRLVPLTGAFNFRDLGGYPTGDGRTTRWGRLFRSDTLHELTEDDVAVLRGLGLATIIDLRTSRELERTGRGPLAPEPMTYRHLSVIRDGEGEAVAAPVPEGEDLCERYLWYLEVGRQPLVDSLALISEPADLPLVFHCAAGKDRTGVLAALVLDILGVDAEVVVADYFLTAGRMELILGRYRSDPVFAERMAQVPASRFGVEEDTMVRFLGALHERFGGARAWAVDSGLAADSFERMEGSLLEAP